MKFLLAVFCLTFASTLASADSKTETTTFVLYQEFEVCDLKSYNCEKHTVNGEKKSIKLECHAGAGCLSHEAPLRINLGGYEIINAITLSKAPDREKRCPTGNGFYYEIHMPYVVSDPKDTRDNVDRGSILMYSCAGNVAALSSTGGRTLPNGKSFHFSYSINNFNVTPDFN